MTNLIIFAVLASIANSIGDAMKFSGAVDQTPLIDWCWHGIKFFIQIPLWLGEGFFLISYIVEHNLWDIWHYKRRHFYLLGLLVVCIIIWQITYKLTIIILT